MVPLVINRRLRRATVTAVINTRMKIRNVSNVEKVRLAISPEEKQKWKRWEKTESQIKTYML